MLDYLKEGFYLANRNFQLVLIRLAATVINIAGLFICLGLPVTVAVTYLSIDMAHADKLLPYLLEKPHEFLSRYIGVILFMGLSIISYFLFVSVIVIYSFGGTLRVLRNSVVSSQYRFSLKSFFREANKRFSRLFRLVSVEFAVFSVLAVIFIFAGVTVAEGFAGFSGLESLPEIFFSSFALLSVTFFGIIVFVIFLVIAVVSVIISVTEGTGVVNTLRKTVNFLRKKPRAFLFFLLLAICAAAANAVLLSVKLSFNVFTGGLILSVASVVLQNYLTVIVWGAMVVYYVKSTDYSSYEI